MKPYVLLFALLITTKYVTAQRTSSVAMQLAIPDTYNGVVVLPTAQFDISNHVWSVGPSLLLSYGDNIEQRDVVKLSGLHFGYTNYLHGRIEKFNLFHSFDLILQRIKDRQDSRHFSTTSGNFEIFEIEQIDKIVQLFANVGIHIRLSEKFSLSQTIGLGVNATFRSTTSPFSDFNDLFVAQDWLIKTGVAYQIGK